MLAFLNQQAVAISDIRETTEWPRYASTAEELGFHSVIGYPLNVGGRRLGALNVYQEGPREWTHSDLEVVGTFADMTTAYLVRSSELVEAKQLADSLQSALDSRVVIEQAKGVLAGEHDIGLDEAFAMLRAHARSSNIRLAELCRAVIETDSRVPVESQAVSQKA